MRTSKPSTLWHQQVDSKFYLYLVCISYPSVETQISTLCGGGGSRGEWVETSPWDLRSETGLLVVGPVCG